MIAGRQKKISEFQNDLMEKHYAEVENMYRTMRGWRHDYHNHIQALAAYLDSGEYERARAYLNEINDTIATVDTVIKTGNAMVDAILNSKLSLMKAERIRTDATVRVPQTLAIKDIDLCVIIGNLLDNCLESCRELPEERRMVRIYIAVKGEGKQLYMSFTNTAGKKRERLGEGFVSAKGKDHGFGLKGVDHLVAKYDGYLTRASEDGGFTTEVILPCRSYSQ